MRRALALLLAARSSGRPDEGLFVTNRGDEAVFAATRLRAVSPGANITFVSDAATLRDVGNDLDVFDVVLPAEAAMPDLGVHDSMGFGSRSSGHAPPRAHTMFDDASAGSLQLYAAIVFVTYAGGCGFISRVTGCKIAACYAGIAYLALRFLGSFDVTSDVAAQLVRLLAFQSYLALFCSMLYGRDAMTFLTNWCLWFRAVLRRRRDQTRLDRVAGVAHAAGFFAAYSVYFGIDVYSAPAAVWRKRGQAFGRWLRLGTPEQLRRGEGRFKTSDDVAFSWIVKYGGVAGALVAARARPPRPLIN
ncbi:hypothetical protein JL722_15214 [Aureococcus anophagefferens]|nr:hypothetical protein JL722_15214 [Aureococcus anophagefferens]